MLMYLFTKIHVQLSGHQSDKGYEKDFKHFVCDYLDCRSLSTIHHNKCNLLYCMFLCEKQQPYVLDIYN